MMVLPVKRVCASEPPTIGPLSTGEVGTLLRKNKIPGAGIAIFDPRRKITVFSHGTARGSIPVSEVTRFQAASISKTLNALLTLTLVRDRLVDLDATVNSQLKTFRLRDQMRIA
jgi:CubicO group peptidase (beta-lactamase class C family)